MALKAVDLPRNTSAIMEKIQAAETIQTRTVATHHNISPTSLPFSGLLGAALLTTTSLSRAARARIGRRTNRHVGRKGEAYDNGDA